MSILSTLGREDELFGNDLKRYEDIISDIVQKSNFLVIGGGGSIGQAVSIELFKRSAKLLHIVDLSENYLVELTREIRSCDPSLTKEYDTFAIDCGSHEFKALVSQGNYDYILNLSAMKHVRSESNPYSMRRMLDTNIINPITNLQAAYENGAHKYFCVSSDKAANPANFMGATKRAMELCLMRANSDLPVSAARFANVAFSNGSLLEGFKFRLEKKQPLSIPTDVKRFFITKKEAGIICLFSTILGKHQEIMFPYNEKNIFLSDFTNIVKNYLSFYNILPVFCNSEDEARSLIKTLDLEKFWPVNCFITNTAGEKAFEEFFTDQEKIMRGAFEDIASIQQKSDITTLQVSDLIKEINGVDLLNRNARLEMLNIMKDFVPTFQHFDSNYFLNARM